MDVWESSRGTLRMWMAAPKVVMSNARGFFDTELARAFLAYLEPRIAGSVVLTGLHDWSGLTGYAPDTRKLPEYCEITLRRVVRSELAARGLAESAGADADLAIVWRVFLTDKTSAQERADPTGNWAYAYGGYSAWTGAPAWASVWLPEPFAAVVSV